MAFSCSLLLILLRCSLLLDCYYPPANALTTEHNHLSTSNVSIVRAKSTLAPPATIRCSWEIHYYLLGLSTNSTPYGSQPFNTALTRTVRRDENVTALPLTQQQMSMISDRISTKGPAAKSTAASPVVKGICHQTRVVTSLYIYISI